MKLPNKARHATPTALRLRLHSVAAHAGWRYAQGEIGAIV